MKFATLWIYACTWIVFVMIRVCVVFGVLAGLVVSSHAADTAKISTGAGITLFATADGSPAPSFQWKKNGNAISGATTPTFSIDNAVLADAASYRVAATNEVGSADSPEFLLEVILASSPVNVPPAITLQPIAPSSPTAGRTVNLLVAASGAPVPIFQWFKNGVAMAGFTDAALTLMGITTNDNATYYATAANSAGSAMSSSVTLVVTVPTSPSSPPPPPVAPPPVSPPPATVAPFFTSQPLASQTTATGATAVFTAAASGTPAPSIQWQKSGVMIDGATSATLSLVGVTSADSATYIAVASNVAGSATSNPAVLVVSAPVAPPTTPPPVQPPPSGGSSQAPVILSQPLSSQTVIAGASASISVSASGNPSPTLQWRKNGTSLLGATSATLVLNGVTARDAATYTVLIANTAGMAVSSNAVLVVNSRPVFTTQPAPQAMAMGAKAVFAVSVSAIPGANVQWMKNHVAIPGATRSVFTIDSVRVEDLAVYAAVATNAVGSASSGDAELLIASPPVLTTQPSSQTVAARSDVTFLVSATGGPAPTLQWKKNGVNIPGATTEALVLRAVEKADEGIYTVEVANIMGWVVSNRASLVVNATSSLRSGGGISSAGTNSMPSGSFDSSRIVNLSVRARVGGAADSLIAGFVISGGSTKPMLLRGIGPALKVFGVSDALSDPTMALYSGAMLTSSNDDWRSNTNMAQIVATSARLGAFGLPESGADAALLTSLEAGAYTVQISGKNSDVGVALVEVYDAALDSPASLVNLSVLTYVGTGTDAPNLGFVIAGTSAKRILIRAVGPALAQFGVTGVIADPQFELYREGVRIDQNDNWGGLAMLTNAFEQVGAFGMKDAGSRDAALLATLEPGAYSVVVSGQGGTTGVTLIEIYDAH